MSFFDMVKRSGLRGSRRRIGKPPLGEAWLQRRDISLPASVTFDRNGREEVRTIGPADVSKNFMQAFLRAQDGLDGSPSDNGQTSDDRPLEDVGGFEVKPAWTELGRKLEFIPVLDDLAVIVVDKELRNATDLDGLVTQVDRLVKELEACGYQHAAVAVAAPDLPYVMEDRIFAAGAQMLEVEPDFLLLDDDSRLAVLRSMIPETDEDDLDYAVDVVEDPDADPDVYDTPNPELSKEDIEGWLAKLGAPLENT